MQHITKPCGSRVRGLIIAGAVSCTALFTPTLVEATGVNTAPDGLFGSEVNDSGWHEHDGPHFLEGDIADLIVPLHGGLCTGTPIAGTVYVVTAAHCVLTGSGEVRKRAVVRDGVLYPAAGVLVDTEYHDHRSVELDAAVLILEQPIPGPSARVGLALPDQGQVTLAGFQWTDGDGALVRRVDPSRRVASEVAAGAPTDRVFRAAGCAESIESLVVTAARVTVPCGLVPGASGGPLLAVENGELVLVGILSTVTTDLSANGVVPLDSLRELLAHPERYQHYFAGDARRTGSPDAIDHGQQ